MIIKSKKAQTGQAITWLHKFFILVLIIGGVVAIIVSHYSRQFDVRDMEASTIARELIECIAPNGILNKFNSEIIRSCITLDERETYLNITMDKNSFVFGDDFLLTLCKAKEEDIKVKYYPSCLRERYYVLDKENNDHAIDLFIAIKKIDKNL